jgi:biopolymer transport protein ExbB
MSLFEMTVKGGWVMIPIALCSVIAVVIIIERFIVLSRSKTNTRHLMMKLKSLIIKGNKEEAVNLCDETPGPAARVLREGLLYSHREKEAIQDAIESAGSREVFRLERYLGVLATVAGVAPLLGFLGTVTGMIRAFMQIERLSGNVNASVLAGGIWEALITTAAGLIVGIPAFIFYNYLMTKVQRLVYEIESSSNELLGLLLEEKQNTYRGELR